MISSTTSPLGDGGWLDAILWEFLRGAYSPLFNFSALWLYHFSTGTEWKERTGTSGWNINSAHFCFVWVGFFFRFICVFKIFIYSLFASLREKLRERTWCRTVGIWLICLEITLISRSDTVNNTGPSIPIIFPILFLLIPAWAWFHLDLSFYFPPVVCFLMFLLYFYFTFNFWISLLLCHGSIFSLLAFYLGSGGYEYVIIQLPKEVVS